MSSGWHHARYTVHQNTNVQSCTANSNVFSSKLCHSSQFHDPQNTNIQSCTGKIKYIQQQTVCHISQFHDPQSTNVQSCTGKIKCFQQQTMSLESMPWWWSPKHKCSILHRQNQMFSAANYVTGVNAMIPKAQMFNPAPAKWSVFSSRLCLYWSQCHDPKTQCSILHRKNEVYSAADYVYTGVNAMIPKHNVQSCTGKN